MSSPPAAHVCHPAPTCPPPSPRPARLPLPYQHLVGPPFPPGLPTCAYPVPAPAPACRHALLSPCSCSCSGPSALSPFPCPCHAPSPCLCPCPCHCPGHAPSHAHAPNPAPAACPPPLAVASTGGTVSRPRRPPAELRAAPHVLATLTDHGAIARDVAVAVTVAVQCLGELAEGAGPRGILRVTRIHQVRGGGCTLNPS